MSESHELSCNLCGLPVKVQGFQLKTTDGVKSFCCEGCVGIYSMLHNPQLVDDHQDNDCSDDEA